MLLAIYLAMLSLSTQERKINLQFLNRHLPYHEWTSGHNFQHQKHFLKKKLDMVINFSNSCTQKVRSSRSSLDISQTGLHQRERNKQPSSHICKVCEQKKLKRVFHIYTLFLLSSEYSDYSHLPQQSHTQATKIDLIR